LKFNTPKSEQTATSEHPGAALFPEIPLADRRYVFALMSTTWTPTARALWLHEFLNPETTLNMTFAGVGGPSFATQGLNFGRDWAVLGGAGRGNELAGDQPAVDLRQLRHSDE